MTYTLINHPQGYNLQKDRALCSLMTLTAFDYGQRHRELAQTHPHAWLGHAVLFIAECIPVIGILVAAIEYLAASYFRSSIPLSNPSTPLSNRTSFTPIVPSPPLPLSPLLPPIRPVDPKPSFPSPATITPGATEPEEPISPLPTNFNTGDELLRETQDYFNHAKIPSPLTFPEINVNGLSQNDLIETLLNKYNGLCIGESHTHSSPKYFLTVNMPLFKRLGVDTLYLEGYHDAGKELEAYFAGDSIDIPASLRNKIWGFAFPHTAGYYCEIDVLMAAKREGIRMVNIDSHAAHVPILGILRAAAMNYQAKLIIDEDRTKHPGGKSIIYAGAAHTNRIAGLPGLGQIYEFPAIGVRDRIFSECRGADAVTQPAFSMQKEYIDVGFLSDTRVRNIDFFIEMDTPLKT